MKIRVTKPSGLFWHTPPLAFGSVAEVPSDVGMALVRAGHAEVLETPPLAHAAAPAEALPEVTQAARTKPARAKRK